MAARVTSEQRRQELIEVALGQYVERGLAATTRTSLAAELGVDRVIVHRLFPDLDELFAAVVDHVRAVGDLAIDEAVAAGDGEAPEVQLRAGIEVILRAARATPDAWRFLFLTPAAPDAAAQLRSLQDHAAARIVGEMVTRGEQDYPDEDPQVIRWGATFLYRGLFATLADHLEHGRAEDDERLVAFLAEGVEGVLADDGA